MADITNINALFAQVKNQFDESILRNYYQKNIYASMFSKGVFDPSMGKTQEVVTATHELPTDYPFPSGMGTISVSSGTGNGCDVTPTVIKSGYTSRTYELQTRSYESEAICLSDLDFEYQAAQQIAAKEEGIRDYITTFWKRWYQVQNIGMIDTKIGTTGASTFATLTNSNYNYTGFSGGNAVDAELEWAHLTALYDEGIRQGMEEFAIGNAGGLPVFSLNIGAGYKRKLWQSNMDVRDTVNWGSAFENFLPLGTMRAINGYVANVEHFPIRYDNSMVVIPPFLNSDATKGRKSVANPAYKTTANGGNAVWESFSITCQDIYQVDVRSTSTGSGMQSFNPKSYAGDLKWINNPDMGTNALGDKGYYRVDIQVAPKPKRPQLGFTGLTLAKD